MKHRVITIPKKTSIKKIIPQKGQVSKPPQKTWTGKDRLDEENHRELRRKKLFYNNKEPCEPYHLCMGKDKVHCIEVVFDEEDDEGIGQDNGEPSHATYQVPLQDIPKGVTIATLLGVLKYYIFRVRGIM
jgi:hypothetical protein